MDIEQLIKQVIDCAVVVRTRLAPGYLEKVYENALLIELQGKGINAEAQKSLNVFYQGVNVGYFVADIVVEDSIIIELKAVHTLNTAHESQLVNYLTSTGIDHGLLINFGNEDKVQIKRKYRTYKPKV